MDVRLVLLSRGLALLCGKRRRCSGRGSIDASKTASQEKQKSEMCVRRTRPFLFRSVWLRYRRTRWLVKKRGGGLGYVERERERKGGMFRVVCDGDVVRRCIGTMPELNPPVRYVHGELKEP